MFCLKCARDPSWKDYPCKMLSNSFEELMKMMVNDHSCMLFVKQVQFDHSGDFQDRFREGGGSTLEMVITLVISSYSTNKMGDEDSQSCL